MCKGPEAEPRSQMWPEPRKGHKMTQERRRGTRLWRLLWVVVRSSTVDQVRGRLLASVPYQRKTEYCWWQQI